MLGCMQREPTTRDDGRPLPRLREVYADDFLIGCTLGGNPLTDYSSDEQALASTHFSALTHENPMKPGRIQPRQGEFAFDKPDAAVDFAQMHGMAMIGHTLVWHQQAAEWMFDSRDRARALGHLRTHIETVVDRYRSRILGWDVVNEAISDKPDEFLRDSRWLEIVGEDFVTQAFRMAHEVDEKTELYYNDYNNELPLKREKTLRLIDAIRQSGTRVDAVGIQGHWELRGVPFEHIEQSIEIYAANGLKVMITELDLDVIPRDFSGADLDGPANAGGTAEHAATKHPADRRDCPPEILLQQAEAYRRLFEMFRSHRKNISRVTFWGLHDGRSWLNSWPTRRTNHPLLFDRELNPKPAFDAIAYRV